MMGKSTENHDMICLCAGTGKVIRWEVQSSVTHWADTPLLCLEIKPGEFSFRHLVRMPPGHLPRDRETKDQVERLSAAWPGKASESSSQSWQMYLWGKDSLGLTGCSVASREDGWMENPYKYKLKTKTFYLSSQQEVNSTSQNLWHWSPILWIWRHYKQKFNAEGWS